MKTKDIKKITYTSPFGIAFVFIEDIKKNMSVKKFKKWQKKSMGSTCLILPNGSSGINTYDLEKFIRLDERGL